MQLFSGRNKDNNNKEVTNKNRQDTGVTNHEVKTPTIQTILAHDGTTLAMGNSAAFAKSWTTLSKNAGNESKKTSPALT
jgi:hypothetical protein